MVSAETVKGEDVVNILPKNGQIKAFENLKKTRGSLSQLQLDELIFEINSREEPS